MLIALTTLDQIWEDPSGNFQKCESIALEASLRGCSLVIFPEMTLTGFTRNVDTYCENFTNSESIEKFQALAKRFSINIIFGMILRKESKPTNSAVAIDSTGEVLGVYSKIHPFSFSEEDALIEAGTNPEVVQIGSFYVGLSICYDLRFPELYSAYADKCGLVINIASWPQIREGHWNILLRARAIDNQYFVAGTNRIGVDGNKIKYGKSSYLVNPAGGFVTAIYSDEKFAIFEIFIEDVTDLRETFPTLRDKNPDLYRTWRIV